MRPDEIASALRRAVRERSIPPGQAINQDEVARRFGVSRIPLREALRTLVGEGLIIMKPGLGAVVTELRASEVDELYGLRLQLEPPLAPYIVEHVRRRDVEDLDALVAAMQSLGQEQSEEWSSLNYRFDRRLYELSERKHTVRLVVQVLNLVEPYARVHAHVLGSRPRMQAERAEVVAALRAGDEARLAELITQTLVNARSTLVASMAEGTPRDRVVGWYDDL
jgi:DNA-binding GntR family transcriptional regulator